MATSFNNTAFTWEATGAAGTQTDIPLDSLTFGGGDVPAVDFTAANSGRKLQVPGLRAPFQITVAGKAPIASSIPAAGSYIDWSITGNTTVGAVSGTNWYVESVEVSGSVDEANSVNITIIEGNGAT
tara:strand:+ start:336 stop:716 length:381 start_codon:yes stop_codon:yes gene_type:complete